MGRIAYLATHGFAVRMIFQTGLLRKLSESGHEVIVIGPDASDPNVTELSRRDGVRLVEYAAAPSRLQRPLKTLRKYVVEDIRANPCLWDKHQESMRKRDGKATLRRAGAKAGLLLNDLVDKAPALRRGFLRAEGKLLLRSEAIAFVKELGLDLLISTYPVAFPEPELLLAAKANGVKTGIHLLSWDNITAKGHFQALADQYIAWGPTMVEELEEFYGVPPNRIKQTGVPHFDLYYDGAIPVESPLLDRLKEGGPYLFFAMSASRYAPGEVDIIEGLCRATTDEGPLAGLRIVARPHPSALTGVMKDDRTMERLTALQKEANLLVSYPKMITDTKMSWSVKNEDMYELVALIRGASVVVNSGSTVNVEALAMGRPVVVTSFDGELKLPYEKSAARLKDYPHLRKLFADGGAIVTTSFGELFAAIERLIDDPAYQSDERAFALRRQIGDQRGGATEAVATALQTLLNSDG